MNSGSRYLIVNIPAFRLDAIENGQSVLSMRVITGREDNPTPVLADEDHVGRVQSVLEHSGVNRHEKNPAQAGKRSGLLSIATTWRPTKAAGTTANVQAEAIRSARPKFVFPNHFNVYLHGTPSASLFKRVERDFSHGCVRLERPLELAKYVLRDQPEWTESASSPR